MSEKKLLISWQTFEAIKLYANLDKQLVCLAEQRARTETVSTSAHIYGTAVSTRHAFVPGVRAHAQTLDSNHINAVYLY